MLSLLVRLGIIALTTLSPSLAYVTNPSIRRHYTRNHHAQRCLSTSVMIQSQQQDRRRHPSSFLDKEMRRVRNFMTRLYSTVKEDNNNPIKCLNTAKSTGSRGTLAGKRAQRLKDLLLEKELRNDISTAEFALTLNVPTQPRETGDGSRINRSSGFIDYEKIAEKLEKNLALIDRRQGRIAAGAAAASTTAGEIPVPPGTESTKDLTSRLSQTRNELKSVLTRVKESMKGQSVSRPMSPTAAKAAAAAAAAALEEGEGEEEKNLNPLTVFVREDGTVDWDGAIQSGKELAKFSGEVFERLQGKSPGEEAPAPRVASLSEIDSSPSIKRLIQLLDQLEACLRNAEEDRDRIVELHRALRRNGLEVSKGQKGELRIAEDQTIELRRRVELQTLDVDMERICAYIEQEIEQSTSFREQKLLVAEYGLLDAQLSTLLSILQNSDMDNFSLVELDEDELKVVATEVQDLKTRLGLVEDPGNKIEWSKMNTYIQESFAKVRKGVSFYVTGAKLLASDLQYAGWLISRAAQGYTLKPREVRTLQRTAKDLLTLIPFTIILIIPLTPVGHVLIFSLLQRIFPGFFPSTFTERRQNLYQMYDKIEKLPAQNDN